MKKKILVFMLLLGIMSGCGAAAEDTTVAGDGEIQTEEVTEAASRQEKETGGYLFVVSGVSLGADMDMDVLLPSLGEAKSVFEAPSCAGQGVSYVYSFGAYEVETYPDEAVNRIGYITLKDDTVATAEGIDLSMTREDVIQAYGQDYTETDQGLTYIKDGMKLSFLFDGESMTCISYVSSVVG